MPGRRWRPRVLLDGGSAGFAAVLLVWVTAPSGALALVVLAAHRTWHGGHAVAAVGVAVLLALTAVSLVAVLGSASSTAGRGFVSLPMLQWLAVVLVLLAALGRAR